MGLNSIIPYGAVDILEPQTEGNLGRIFDLNVSIVQQSSHSSGPHRVGYIQALDSLPQKKRGQLRTDSRTMLHLALFAFLFKPTICQTPPYSPCTLLCSPRLHTVPVIYCVPHSSLQSPYFAVFSTAPYSPCTLLCSPQLPTVPLPTVPVIYCVLHSSLQSLYFTVFPTAPYSPCDLLFSPQLLTVPLPTVPVLYCVPHSSIQSLYFTVFPTAPYSPYDLLCSPQLPTVHLPTVPVIYCVPQSSLQFLFFAVFTTAPYSPCTLLCSPQLPTVPLPTVPVLYCVPHSSLQSLYFTVFPTAPYSPCTLLCSPQHPTVPVIYCVPHSSLQSLYFTVFPTAPYSPYLVAIVLMVLSVTRILGTVPTTALDVAQGIRVYYVRQNVAMVFMVRTADNTVDTAPMMEPGPQCAHGYQGPQCQIECGDGFYGEDCRQDFWFLSFHYWASHCAPGYRGGQCQTACAERKFGADCTQTCHCRLPDECSLEDGRCLYGGCEEGWTGLSCQDDVDECVSQPCKNGATCANTPPAGSATYSCDCAPGWTGTNYPTPVRSLQLRNISSTVLLATWEEPEALNGELLYYQVELFRGFIKVADNTVYPGNALRVNYEGLVPATEYTVRVVPFNLGPCRGIESRTNMTTSDGRKY
ncbi:hypothetical protein Bbelb_359660 [Branchiostoma belcheri]|nr:hypothetical protein Bbelb_359660 [Branchiostoma belcheri]